ncbi:hypothetical protein JCM8547_009380 [Rhodosporidiobolus lusitaniae]
MVRSARDVLFGAYEATPAGANVFAVLAENLKLALYPDTPDSFRTQLWVLIGFYSVEVAFFLAAFLVRARKIHQWFPFRLHSSSRGTYIAPHYVLSYQALSAVFLSLLLGYAYTMIHHSRKKVVANYLVWVELPWISIWIAAMLAMWSLAVALVSPSTGALRKHDWVGSAVFLNTIFFTTIAVCTTFLCVTTGISQKHYSSMLDAYHVVRDELDVYAASFEPTLPASTVEAQLESLVPSMQTFLDRQQSHDVYFRTVFALWVVAGVVVLTTFFLIGPRYFRHLHSQLRTLSGSSPRPSHFTTTGSFKLRKKRSSGDSITWSDPRAALERAFVDMVAATIAIIAGATVNMSISLGLAITGSDRANDAVPLQVFLLVSLYAPAIVALPTCLLSLFRALQHTSLAARPAVLDTLVVINQTSSSGGGGRRKPGNWLNLPDDHYDGRRGGEQNPPAFRIEVTRTVEVELEERKDSERTSETRVEVGYGGGDGEGGVLEEAVERLEEGRKKEGEGQEEA